MKRKIYQCLIMISALVISFLSCHQQHSKSEIESAMRQYDHYIQKMDTDSIASMFTPDGDLGDVAHGRT